MFSSKAMLNVVPAATPVLIGWQLEPTSGGQAQGSGGHSGRQAHLCWAVKVADGHIEAQSRARNTDVAKAGQRATSDLGGVGMAPKLNPAADAGTETIRNGSKHRAILTQAERMPDTAKDRVYIGKIWQENGAEGVAKW